MLGAAPALADPTVTDGETRVVDVPLADAPLVEADGARVVFSGDLGRGDHPLVEPREDPPAADVMVVESTYGDREHPEPEVPHAEMAEAIVRTQEAEIRRMRGWLQTWYGKTSAE